jgi:murein DD-endopeptidase MepM/ murein hydrolase activator NlpD
MIAYARGMIFSPVPGTPLITQGFGQNPQIYSQFGYAGHNGIDIGLAVGTPIYAPHDGVVTIKDDGAKNYGLYVVIDAPTRRSILAHLSAVNVVEGQSISQGDPIVLSGQSGMCFGPHLHWTFKLMKNGAVQNKDNGYDGAIDVTELTRLWLDKDMHRDATYTDDAKPYLDMAFEGNQYLKRVIS